MKRIKFAKKKGAASFYIVAFSTLILVIIAASFATAIINEMRRTSNEDLSQSAYDSALAGVEDAKVAYLNYQRCKQSGAQQAAKINEGDSKITCGEIMYWMAHPDCLMVGHILGRIPKTVKNVTDDGSEVLISDTVMSGKKEINNNLRQAYTCVKINTELTDWKGNLTSTSNSKVVNVKLSGNRANSLSYVKIKWYRKTEQMDAFNYGNILENVSPSWTPSGTGNWRVAFLPIDNKRAATPPALQVEFIQTASVFNIEDLTKIVRKGGTGPINRTDRGMVLMVPTDDKDRANVAEYDIYDSDKGQYANSNYQWWGSYVKNQGVAHSGQNFFPSRWFADSNAAGGGFGGQNPSYLVYCPDDSDKEYACEAIIDMPAPYDPSRNGTTQVDRNGDTFMFIITLPYGQPDTEFSLEFFCPDGTDAVCSTVTDSSGQVTGSNQINLEDVQVTVDSTGRANDLFRRVETRLDTKSNSVAYPIYGIQLLSNSSKDTELLKKDLTIKSEQSSGDYQRYINEMESTDIR